ncbi:YqaJ viral recombinase family protein [Ralstonia pseudosolanacearum]|uniref:YqaJ viral recombinase family nuclease n=1 Tax=Ralstonia pseudosolanacearum TaxID=1310165 RepID=UPI003CECFD31
MAMQVLQGPATVQGSPEWLAWRKQGIGASDAPIIMGKSLYTRAYELFKHKTGKGPDPRRNPILEKIRERGHKLEPVARAAFEKLTNTQVTPIVAVSSIHPFIRASFDGFDMFSGEPTEIKCPGARAHKLALDGIVPDEYVDQLQHQMFVAESDWANYYSFDGTDGVWLRVARDQARIDQIVANELDFWNRVQSGIWETDEWASAATLYLIIEREYKEIEERRQLARQALIDLLGPNEEQKEGSGVLVTKSFVKGKVDYAKILADRNISLTDAELNGYRANGSDSVRVTVTKDIDLTAIDPSPLSLNPPKPVEVPALPDLGRYKETIDLVI